MDSPFSPGGPEIKISICSTTAYKKRGVPHVQTVKSYFKACGLYKFAEGFGWAYQRGESGNISRGGTYKQIKVKAF